MADFTPILTAIQTYLAGAATSYHIQAPNNAALPYVQWEADESHADLEMAVYKSENEGERVWLTLHCWGATLAQASALHDTIATRFHTVKLAPTGWLQAWRPRREMTRPIRDQESKAYQVVSRWQLRFVKS